MRTMLKLLRDRVEMGIRVVGTVGMGGYNYLSPCSFLKGIMVQVYVGVRDMQGCAGTPESDSG